MALNLQGFSKTKETPSAIELTHEMGHKVVLAKKAISDEARKHIDKLPGQYANEDADPDAATVAPDQSLDPVQANSSGIDWSNIASTATKLMTPQGIGSLIAEGASYKAPTQNPNQSMATPVSDNSDHPMSVMPSNYPLAQASDNAPASPPNPAQQQIASQSQMGQAYQQAAQEERQALQQKANAEVGQAGAQSAVLGNQQYGIPAEQQLMQDYQGNIKAAQQEYQNSLDDYRNGHYSAADVFANKGVLGKIGTTIGLILGGISGGLNGTGQNPAMQMLLNQADAEAMKNKELLDANLKKVGNVNTAAQMSQLQHGAVVKGMLEKAALDSASPIAKANAQLGMAAVDEKMAPIMQQMAMMQSMQNLGKNGAQIDPASHIRMLEMSGMVRPEESSKMYEELQKAEEISKQGQNSLKAFDTVAQTKSPGWIAQNPREAYSGALDNQMNAAMGELGKATTGRYNAEEAAQLVKQFKPTLKDTDKDVQLKRKNLLNYIKQNQNFPRLQAHGVQIPQIAAPMPNTNAGAMYKQVNQ